MCVFGMCARNWLRLIHHVLHFDLATEELQLGHNRLKGTLLSSSLRHAAGLKLLSLAQNDLTGSFPESVTSLTSLVQLDLSFTGFHGIIPDEGWEAFNQLEVLDNLGHSFSNWTGPSWDNFMTNLRKLMFHETPLSGSIPTEIGRMTSLGKTLEGEE